MIMVQADCFVGGDYLTFDLLYCIDHHAAGYF